MVAVMAVIRLLLLPMKSHTSWDLGDGTTYVRRAALLPSGKGQAVYEMLDLCMSFRALCTLKRWYNLKKWLILL